jgi:hypothetical protein
VKKGLDFRRPEVRGIMLATRVLAASFGCAELAEIGVKHEGLPATHARRNREKSVDVY